MNGQSLKLHFCMFEKSQEKHNIVIMFFGIVITNFIFSKFDTNKFSFACSKHSNFKSGKSLFFSNVFFFLPNVYHSF